MIQLVILAFVVALASGVVWTYNSAIKENVVLEANNRTLTKAQEDTEKELKAARVRYEKAEKLVAARRAAEAAAAKERSNLDAKLDDIRNRIPQVREWAETPVPGPILDELREPAGARPDDKGGKGTPAGKPAH